MKSARIAEIALWVLLSGAAGGCGDNGGDQLPSSGASATGGTGDTGTGGAGAAGDLTGGVPGDETGGVPETSTGGASVGGDTGGTPGTGGSSTGGDETDGVSTGGMSTGGDETGGTSTGTGGADTSDSCSSTATVGLEVGDLIPDVELQRCDGSPVNLHDLVCGNVVTHVYSYASWCPGCRGFSGLEDVGITGNSMHDSYHDDGYEQVIILSANEDFTKPTEEDCAALQALHSGLVVYDATGSKTTDVLGLKINGGTGLVDEQGLWIVAPPKDDSQDGGMSAVFSELMSRFGFRG